MATTATTAITAAEKLAATGAAADAERLRAEKLAALKADIAIGLQQADAGLLVDGESMFAELRAEFCVKGN